MQDINSSFSFTGSAIQVGLCWLERSLFASPVLAMIDLREFVLKKDGKYE